MFFESIGKDEERVNIRRKYVSRKGNMVKTNMGLWWMPKGAAWRRRSQQVAKSHVEELSILRYVGDRMG